MLLYRLNGLKKSVRWKGLAAMYMKYESKTNFIKHSAFIIHLFIIRKLCNFYAK